ncbi:PREDICTED: tryptophanase 1-like [Priapulus caudatus]|uniref:Tryptophanase 1-like n=1 Tax=Priapulus caudatus TaxID=37621 RepID=A0ABM1F8C5_PRICU|nr:PREDICTED: tryptophanase 1-like [Priapulus caudatus]
MMLGDEGYCGSVSYQKLEETIKSITGYEYVLPTHQGRAAERILYGQLLRPGCLVISNCFYSTTKGNIEEKAHAKTIALPQHPIVGELKLTEPFHGNMDITELQQLLAQRRRDVGCVIVTLTANDICGQPVSMENVRQVSRVCRSYDLPVVLDACRYAENAWFVKTREHGFADASLEHIAREAFSYGDACIVSAKKDGFGNVGAFIGIRGDRALYEKCLQELCLTQGFPTNGGISGRSMEALAVGLRESLDLDYLQYRMSQVSFLTDLIADAGIPTVWGSHVYVDAGAILDHMPREHYPAWALANALYVEGGIRGYEFGRVNYGDGYTGLDMLRFALPRRVYTNRHLEYVAEVLRYVAENKQAVSGYCVDWAPPVMRHFLGTFKPIRSEVEDDTMM